MTYETPKLNLILYKRRGEHFLAACRGVNKGCNVQLKQRQKMGPCDDCVLCDDDNETLEQLVARINKGNA